MDGTAATPAMVKAARAGDGDAMDRLYRRFASVVLEQALALAPEDAGMRFAAALVARADGREADRARHAAAARDAAAGDRMLARNLALVGR